MTALVGIQHGLGISKGVGFVRFDRKSEAEEAIEKLNGTIPTGCTEPITVKFANNPAANAQKAQLQVLHYERLYSIISY